MTPTMAQPGLPGFDSSRTNATYSPALDRTVKLLIVLVVTLVTSMEFLTSYAVGVALPDIQGDLAASFDEGSWILTTYTTCFLIGLVLSNWMSDRIGYRRYMIGAVVLFMCSSVGCGMSHTLAQILVFRGFMGFAGGNFLTRAQTAIYRTHVGPARVKALLILVIGVVICARTWGAAVGGYLTEWYSWRYIFFLNVPLALAALVMLIAFLPDVKASNRPARLDVAGLLLLIGWLASLQIVLSRGERDDWFADPFIVTLTIIAAACLPLFIWWEARPGNANPIISLRTYGSRNFAVGSIYVVILGMMLYGQTYVVPQFLRNIQHHSAWGTGKLQTVNAIAFTIGLIVGGLLMMRIGYRRALAIGAATFTAGMWCWATRLTPSISDQAMMLPLALTGFGAGWQVGPVSSLINSQTSNLLLGEGMELYLCQRQLGGSWGIAILTIVIDRQRSFWSGRLAEGINVYNLHAQDAMRQGAAALRAGGFSELQSDAGAMGLIHARLLIQSVVNAFVDTFRYQTALGVSAALLVLLFARGRSLATAARWIVTMVR
ncbi:MAG: emrB [Phycisphaerales bacterium]|nr:emrB [Phycisphaerales bacterium]